MKIFCEKRMKKKATKADGSDGEASNHNGI